MSDKLAKTDKTDVVTAFNILILTATDWFKNKVKLIRNLLFAF